MFYCNFIQERLLTPTPDSGRHRERGSSCAALELPFLVLVGRARVEILQAAAGLFQAGRANDQQGLFRHVAFFIQQLWVGHLPAASTWRGLALSCSE
jgi:hypothetical protein